MGKPRLTLEIFKERITLKHNGKYLYHLISVYIDNKQYGYIVCPKHGKFRQRLDMHMRGQGCDGCAHEKNHDGHRYTTEEFKRRAKKKHNKLYLYPRTVYIDSKTEVIITCRIHGDFSQRPYAHLNGQGCEKCKFSRGEKILCDYLTEILVDFITQKKFSDCKDTRHLKFDIYIIPGTIPGHNGYKTVFIIEYDGRQHYDIIEERGGIKEFEKTVQHDHMKNQYCIDHGYYIIRVPYYVKNPIEYMIKKFDASKEELIIDLKIREMEQRLTLLEYHKKNKFMSIIHFDFIINRIY